MVMIVFEFKIKAEENMKEYFLKTNRLGFSTWEKNDVKDAMELWGNPNVTKFITANGVMQKEQVMERLEKEINTSICEHIQYWPVYKLDSNQHIGCCGLRPYDAKKNIVEMGIHLKENAWGKGYAYEACIAVIEYAFEMLKFDGIFAGHNPKNQTSASLLEKLGFTYIKDEFYTPTGLFHPSYLMVKENYVTIKEMNKAEK